MLLSTLATFKSEGMEIYIVYITSSFVIYDVKGRGPGINSSQSKKVGKKFSFLRSFLIRVSFFFIYGVNDYNKFSFFACEQQTCLCIIRPAFVVLEKLS